MPTTARTASRGTVPSGKKPISEGHQLHGSVDTRFSKCQNPRWRGCVIARRGRGWTVKGQLQGDLCGDGEFCMLTGVMVTLSYKCENGTLRNAPALGPDGFPGLILYYHCLRCDHLGKWDEGPWTSLLNWQLPVNINYFHIKSLLKGLFIYLLEREREREREIMSRGDG